MKKITLACALILLLAGCEREADVASKNVSKAADAFQVLRRIVFVNVRTDTFLLQVNGYCALGNADAANELTVTCKTGPSQYKKHFLHLAPEVTYFVEQIEPAHASGYHYSVIFRPTTIIPSIGLDLGEKQ